MSRVEERLRFEPDGRVTALSGKMEYGQGLRAAYPRIVAEELGVSASSVDVVLGDTDVSPWDMGTFGSMSVEMDGHELRCACAAARSILLSRAAARLGVLAGDLGIENGTVIARSSGVSVSFAELVAEGPVSGEVPDDVRPQPPPSTVPDAPPGSEAVGMVTGRAEFVADVRLPGMLHGRVAHPATFGARLHSVDREAAARVPGVVAVIVEGDFAAVVAERTDQAVRAVQALSPVWEPPAAVEGEVTDLHLRDDAGVKEALGRGVRRERARYVTPHVASMPIGPSVGLADVRPDQAFVYGSTQVPFRLRDAVARMTGLPPGRVHFCPKAMSGGFGRHGSSDAAIEAVRLSKGAGRPVLVQWGRPDELRAAPHRPRMEADLDAAVDGDGRIRAWRSEIRTNPYSYDAAPRSGLAPSPAAAARPGWDPAQMTAMMAGRNALPPYAIEAVSVRLIVAPARVRTGALRSLGASPNVFAIESHVDVLARAAGFDPIDLRLRNTDDPRLRRVLEAVRDRSGWRSSRRKGYGLGAACVIYRNTYVAEVVEVAVGADGRVGLERAWCAVDCGHVVHPDGARNQIEGAIQMAASWTLLEVLVHRDGESPGATWDDYPIATFLDAPRSIDVVFTGADSTPSSGLGEPPAVPVAPAIANAVFDACGVRVRVLPIRAARA